MIVPFTFTRMDFHSTQIAKPKLSLDEIHHPLGRGCRVLNVTVDQEVESDIA